jgi:hypothetical protein
LLGWQCLSFFPHEGPRLVRLDLLDLDVLHELVVKELGMVPGSVGDAQDGIQPNAAQTTGRPHAIALDDVLSNLEDFLDR